MDNYPEAVPDDALVTSGSPEVSFDVSESTHSVPTHSNQETVAHDKVTMEEMAAPAEEWLSLNGLARAAGASDYKVKKILASKVNDHPEWVSVAGDTAKPQTRYSSSLVPELRKELGEIESAPEGWVTIKGLAKTLGVSADTVQRVAETSREEHPGWFADHRNHRGQVAAHYDPALVERIKGELSTREPAPEGWLTGSGVAKNLGVDVGTVQKIAERLAETHPAWQGSYMDGSRKVATHYHPDLIDAVSKDVAGRESAPEGWMANRTLGNELGAGFERVAKIAETFREAHPEWYQTYYTQSGTVKTEHFHPDLVAKIRQEALKVQAATSDWHSKSQIAESMGVGVDIIGTIAERHRVEHPEWFQDRRRGDAGKGSAKISEHYSEELTAIIKTELASRQPAPEGWLTASGYAALNGYDHRSIKRLADVYREEHPGWFGSYKERGGRLTEHYHPDLLIELGHVAKRDLQPARERRLSQLEQERLRQDVQKSLEDIAKGESPDAQEFQALVGLFGAECAIDILYHQHSEYGKIPVPYVRSVLGDYLGDFLSIRGGFSLEALERGAPLLGNTTFKNALVEVVKGDCLRLLNHISRTDPDSLSAGAIREYMTDLRQATASFDNSHLNEALDEVEAYYQLLFQNIHKPDRFIDGLEDGRLFPDINQRINVQEISFKERVLIADEMGTGKSASAIMAKEIIGVRQALVVLPSNVIDTWLGYLSDQVGEDGEQIGYFKPGQTPRVLVVDSLQALQDANPDEYEYILISQERLNESYVEALNRFNYKMLIVDEMHKLKNISDGRRAESLVALSQRIEDAGNYLVLLSGTPVPNKVSDIAITLKLLYPQEFRDVNDKDLVNQIVKGDLLNLRSLLVPRMQMKSLAETVDMPEHEEIVRTFPLSSQEREVYEILIDEDELTAAEKLAILRQCVLNPRFLDATPDLASSKIAAVGEDLRQTFAEKDKVVMFVNNYVEGVIRGDVTILAELGVPGDVEVLVIDGSVDKQRRREIQQELNRGHKKVLVVVSGQTADVGVDFSGAQEVYIYNEPWTMYDKRQAISRVYRPGLKAPLKTRTYVAADTIEQGIHHYIETKYQAVEKLLRGVPISEIEAQMLRRTEATNGSEAEVNAELAEYYFSSWDKMMRIYSQVKELGEKDFQKFLDRYGDDYAESYASVVGSRSYQANVSRMAASHIRSLALADGKKPEEVIVLDVASGPEMLKKHAPSDLVKRVVSLDVNTKHFTGPGTNRIVGSFVNLPIRDKAIDYVNLSLGLHYTSFAPRRGNYERLKVLQEINRVLPVGGQALVSMIYSMGLPYDENFSAAMNKLGFLVVDAYSGEVVSGNNFRTQLITLRKIRDCNPDAQAVAGELGPEGLQSLKLKRTKTSLRNSRGILTSYPVNDATIQAVLNENDLAVLEEEGRATQQMEGLKQQYGAIKAIPREVIQQSGLSRIFNGKRYVLFKRLSTDPTAVVIK